jgi:hypothetical protein
MRHHSQFILASERLSMSRLVSPRVMRSLFEPESWRQNRIPGDINRLSPSGLEHSILRTEALGSMVRGLPQRKAKGLDPRNEGVIRVPGTGIALHSLGHPRLASAV